MKARVCRTRTGGIVIRASLDPARRGEQELRTISPRGKRVPPGTVDEVCANRRALEADLQKDAAFRTAMAEEFAK